MKKVVLIILGTLILLIGGFSVFYFLKLSSPNPVVVFKSAINYAYDNINEMLTKESTINGNDFEMKANIKFDTDIEMFKNLTEYDYNVKIASNTATNKALFSLGLAKENQIALESIVYLINNNAYLSIPDVTYQIIKLNNITGDFEIPSIDTSKIKTDDILYIIKTIKDIYLDTLSEDQFMTTNETLKIDGQDVKVTKICYEINKDNALQIQNQIIDGMLADNQLLTKMATISSKSINDIKTQLEEAKITELDDEFNPVEVNLYLQDKQIVKVELTDGTDIIEIVKNDENFEVNIVGKDNGISFILAIQDKKYEVDIKFNFEDYDINCHIISTYSEENNIGIGNLSFDFIMKNATENMNFNFNINYQISSPANLPYINPDAAIEYTELPEEELNKLMEKIMELGLMDNLIPENEDIIM